MARSLVLVVLVFFFVGVLVASAQPVNPCTRIHVPRTAVTLFTTTGLSSQTATEGEEIQLRVDSEIRIDDCLLIAKGATVRGHVTTVQKAKSFMRPGKLAIGVESIQTVGAMDAGTLGITAAHVVGANDLAGEGSGGSRRRSCFCCAVPASSAGWARSHTRGNSIRGKFAPGNDPGWCPG